MVSAKAASTLGRRGGTQAPWNLPRSSHLSIYPSNNQFPVQPPTPPTIHLCIRPTIPTMPTSIYHSDHPNNLPYNRKTHQTPRLSSHRTTQQSGNSTVGKFHFWAPPKHRKRLSSGIPAHHHKPNHQVTQPSDHHTIGQSNHGKIQPSDNLTMGQSNHGTIQPSEIQSPDHPSENPTIGQFNHRTIQPTDNSTTRQSNHRTMQPTDHPTIGQSSHGTPQPSHNPTTRSSNNWII